MQMTYFTKQVAEMLDVQPVTVRSWGPKFEERGHVFLRDERGSRAFSDADVALFKRYLRYTKEMGMNQTDAIDAALSEPVDSTELAVISPHAMGDTDANNATRYGEMQRQISSLTDAVHTLTGVVQQMALHSDQNARMVHAALATQNEQIAAVAATVHESLAALPAAQPDQTAPKREYWWSRIVRDMKDSLSDV